MDLDITCPVDHSVIGQYDFDVDIATVVEKHMKEEHPTWFKRSNLEWATYGDVQCPFCAEAFRKIQGVYVHVTAMHPGWVKISGLDFRFDQQLYDEVVAKKSWKAS